MTDIEENTPPPQEDAPARQSHKGLVVLVAVGLLAAAVCTAGGWLYMTDGALFQNNERAQRLDALDHRLDALESALNAALASTASTPEALAALEEKFQYMKAQIEEKNTRANQPVQEAVIATLAFWDLRDAAKDGQPFDEPLARLRVAFADNPSLDPVLRKLVPFASSKTPTFDQLQDVLVLKEADIPVESDNDASWITKIKRIFRPLITVKPRQDPRFSPLEEALASQDPQRLHTALDSLPEQARAALAPWAADVDKRLALDAILKELNTAFSVLSPPAKARP
ncbi:MAG: hypothetical protein PHS57_02640 [Alphaproteobacteria bacterium]|nr:hypothetical protein [Alphaproteobacteria bacterium]